MFAQMRVNGTNIDMRACCADPIFYFIHLQLEGLLEVCQGYFGLVLSASDAVLLFVVAGQVVEGDACYLVDFGVAGVDLQLLCNCPFCFLEVLESLAELA